MTKARDIASAAPAPSTVSATEIGYLDGVTSAIQTQLDAKTAKSTLTTTGDIYYASSANTPARLGIGSTDQILKVTGGVPAWATPAAATSGLTLITKSPFTTVSSHSVNNCFTSTYANYKVLIKWTAQSADDVDLSLKLRLSGSDTTTNYGSQRLYAYSSSVASETDQLGTDEWPAGVADKDFPTAPFLEMEIASPQVATNTAMVARQWGYTSQPFIHFIGGRQASTTQFDGFTILASSGTMSGTVWVYGYQEA
jgi:hypothetical protein